MLLLLLYIVIFLSWLFDQPTTGRFRAITWVMVEIGDCNIRWMISLLFPTAILSPFWWLLLCRRRLLEHRYKWRCRWYIPLPSYLLNWLCMLMQSEIPKHLRYLSVPSYLLRTHHAALFLWLLHGYDWALIILKQEGIYLQLGGRLLGMDAHELQRSFIGCRMRRGSKVFKRILHNFYNFIL